MRSVWLSRGIAGAGVAVSALACEWIVGIGPQPHLADAGDAAVEASVTCTLPTTGDAQVRLANVVPSLDAYDFCLTQASGQTPAGGVLGSSGTCPPGLLYRSVLAPFSVPSGTYRVDAITPGSTCDPKNVLATAPSVNLDPQTTTTVVLFGTGSSTQLQLKSFREEEGSIAEPKVRFINAWSDGPSSLECGVTTSDELPTRILGAELNAQGTLFANAPPPSSTIDALGYFSLLGGVIVPIGFAATGTGTTTGVTVARNVNTLGSISTFAIGTTADPRFPVDLMVCNQDAVDGIFTRCSNLTPDDLIVDVYNAQLEGRFTPTEADRRSAVNAAVAGLDADFACITEVWDPTDRAALVAAAKTRFPYSATFTTDLTTTATNPRDQNGNVPPAYTTPACSGGSTSLSQSFLSCLSASCSNTTPNDPNGEIVENGTQCVVANCLTPGIQLIADPGCYSCVITQVESGATFASAQSACTTNPLARFAFNGGNGIILLSTHPFLTSGTSADAGADASTDAGDGGLPSDDAPGLYVFPSTEWRAVMIRAPVNLTSASGIDTKVDVYCALLTTPATSAERPYTGFYGGTGSTDAAKWVNENTWQATQLTTYVKATSGARKRRAIIAGDFYTGPAIGTLQALNVQSYNVLTPILPLAMAPAYTPQCTFCGSNPLVNGAGESTASTWSSYSLLSDLAVPEVQSNTVILQGLSATTNPAAFGLEAGTLQIPASFYYGMRTVIRVRP